MAAITGVVSGPGVVLVTPVGRGLTGHLDSTSAFTLLLPERNLMSKSNEDSCAT